MSTHTPGPWEVDFGKIIAKVGNGPEYPTVARTYAVLESVNGAGISFVERTSNARLISASPELLEALRAARPYVDRAYECAFPDYAENELVLAMVDAAIAKATGGRNEHAI